MERLVMLRRTLLILLLLFACGTFALAQAPSGLDVNISVDTNAFELRQRDKSDVELRKEGGSYGDSGQVGRTIALPFSNHNWYSGTNVSFSYDGGFFGAAFGLDVTTSDQRYYDRERREWFDLYPVSAGAMNAWVRPFNWFKISIGRGIASGYADAQGGEALRVFTGNERDGWDSARAIDDVVQDEGVLLETFYGPASLAIAGRYYRSELFGSSLNANYPMRPRDTMYSLMEQRNFSYGARIGAGLGEWGKFSASYILEYDNITGKNYGSDRNDNLVPVVGGAEFTRHLFGLFASLYPLADLGVSLSYTGVYTLYPRQIYSAGLNSMVNLTLPSSYQQGISLNARYSGINRWVFRTDHNLSFWGDKNFTIFGLPALANAGIDPSTDTTRNYPTIGHVLIWNGLGLNYQLTDTWKLDVYARNLYRRDSAEGAMQSGMPQREYVFTRNMTVCELKGIWSPRDNMEFFMGVTIENTITLISKDVAFDTVGVRDSFVLQADARDIKDTDFIIKIPIGITVRIR